MDKDNQPKTHVEQIDEPKAAKAANKNPSIQREKVLDPMDPASTSVKSENDISKSAVKQKLESGKENAGKTHAEREQERSNASKNRSEGRGFSRGGGNSGFGSGNANGRIDADDLKRPQDMINLDDDLSKNDQPQQNKLDNISTADFKKDEIDQSGQISQPVTENDNIQLALNDFSSQPSIDNNTSSFDEISKEDFKTALNDVYSSIQEKDEIDQSGQTPQNPSENDNVQLALNDFSSQPSIDDNTTSFDEISKEDFKAALNDVNSSLQEKDEVAEMSNDLGQEDFSTALADLKFDERKIKDTVGIPDRDSEDGKEEVLEAMNDFTSNEPMDGDTEKFEYFEIDPAATEDFSVDEVNNNNDMDDIDLGNGEGGGDGMDMEM